MRRAVYFALIGLGISEPVLAQSHLIRTEIAPPIYKATASEAVIAAFDRRPDETGRAVFAALAGQTRLAQPPGTPLQVVYTDPRGGVTLWFPQSGEVRRGQWHVQERIWELIEDGRVVKTRRSSSICFNYPGRPGSGCPSFSLMKSYQLDQNPGDLFGLASGTSPGVVTNGPVRRLADIARRTGR